MEKSFLHRVLLSNEGPFLCFSVDLVTPNCFSEIVRVNSESEWMERMNAVTDAAFHIPKL